jgi:hypothetical protein
VPLTAARLKPGPLCLPPHPPVPRQVSERLQGAIRSVQGLVAELRAACEEVGHGAARAKREVEGSRQGLKAALRQACARLGCCRGSAGVPACKCQGRRLAAFHCGPALLGLARGARLAGPNPTGAIRRPARRLRRWRRSGSGRAGGAGG